MKSLFKIIIFLTLTISINAQIKLSALPSASSIASADLFLMTQSSVSKSTSFGLIETYFMGVSATQTLSGDYTFDNVITFDQATINMGTTPLTFEQGQTIYTEVLGSDNLIINTNGEDLDINVAGGGSVSIAAGDLFVGGNSTVFDATIYGHNAYTITAGDISDNTISADGISYLVLTNDTGACNINTITDGVQGQILYLNGSSSVAFTITFIDDTNLKLSGSFAMSSYDALVLLHNGSEWVQQSESNN